MDGSYGRRERPVLFDCGRLQALVFAPIVVVVVVIVVALAGLSVRRRRQQRRGALGRVGKGTSHEFLDRSNIPLMVGVVDWERNEGREDGCLAWGFLIESLNFACFIVLGGHRLLRHDPRQGPVVFGH